jgi:hypothetical protein
MIHSLTDIDCGGFASSQSKLAISRYAIRAMDITGARFPTNEPDLGDWVVG